jgi:hypothetical protein
VTIVRAKDRQMEQWAVSSHQPFDSQQTQSLGNWDGTHKCLWRWDTPDFCPTEIVKQFPPGENRGRRWPTIGKERQFWFNTSDCQTHSRTSFSFMQNMIQTSQGLERDMSQKSSRETRA